MMSALITVSQNKREFTSQSQVSNKAFNPLRLKGVTIFFRKILIVSLLGPFIDDPN